MRTSHRFTERVHRAVFVAIVSAATGVGGLRAQSMTVATGGTSTGRTQTVNEQVQHVLNRLAFGARPGDVERVRAMGVDAWIAQQLDPATIPDATTEAWLTQFPTLRMSGAEFVATYPSAAQLRRAMRAPATTNRAGRQAAPQPTMTAASAADSARVRDAARALTRASSQIAVARVGRAVTSERQLQEVMVEFWANHFNVFIGKPQTRPYIAEYEREAIRPHVLGSFRELLGAVAKSPAMLAYLDQAQSMADSSRPTLVPNRARRTRGTNENYARELMELHTLGVDGGYTQTDVTEVARALTGWTLDRAVGQGGRFVFQPRAHDAGAKTILGQRFPAGRGQDEGERVLDLLAAHPSTARFIASKLAQYFVSDVPPEALVTRAAATFTKTRGDIREVVRTIITSDEFFSTEAYRAKVKTPFQLVVSTARALDGQADATPRTAQLIAQLGQPIYGRATPDGYPDAATEWMNTGAILNRINFGVTVAEGKLPGTRRNVRLAAGLDVGGPEFQRR